jgi:hypothetical protein
MKVDVDIDISVEVIRDPDWWRPYRLVLVGRAGRSGKEFRSSLYGRYWSRTAAEAKARTVLAGLATEPAPPQVVSTVRSEESA